MRRWPIALIGFVVANAANAETVKLRDKTYVKVDAKRDHVLVAHIMIGRSTASTVGYALMTRAVAIKAQEQSYPRFAIVKGKCDEVGMGGSPLYSQCSLTAQLLGPTDKVTVKHDDAPRMVEVADELAAPISPSN